MRMWVPLGISQLINEIAQVFVVIVLLPACFCRCATFSLRFEIGVNRYTKLREFQNIAQP